MQNLEIWLGKTFLQAVSFPWVKLRKKYMEAKTLGALGHCRKEELTEPCWVVPNPEARGRSASPKAITETA